MVVLWGMGIKWATGVLNGFEGVLGFRGYVGVVSGVKDFGGLKNGICPNFTI